MGGIRRHRKIIAWVAIMGLIGNLVAAMLCCVPANGAFADAADALLGPAVICSDHPAATSATVDDTDSPPIASCPLCLTAAAVALVFALAAIILLMPLPARGWIAFVCATTPADALRRTGLGSRAPPLPA
jgi:hypothetical protein